MCITDTSTRQKQSIENVNLLRTVHNYATHARHRTYGVKEECIFHLINNFHITINRSVDIMHDLFEGICRYDLGHLLFNLIYKDKLFSCDTLNSRIYSFDYGDKYSANKPPLIV